jgi:hypothetical protein
MCKPGIDTFDTPLPVDPLVLVVFRTSRPERFISPQGIGQSLRNSGNTEIEDELVDDIRRNRALSTPSRSEHSRLSPLYWPHKPEISTVDTCLGHVSID